MYEDLVKEMNVMTKQLDKDKKTLTTALEKGTTKELNAEINKELKQSNVNTIDFEELQKITGVKNGKHRRKK